MDKDSGLVAAFKASELGGVVGRTYKVSAGVNLRSGPYPHVQSVFFFFLLLGLSHMNQCHLSFFLPPFSGSSD